MRSFEVNTIELDQLADRIENIPESIRDIIRKSLSSDSKWRNIVLQWNRDNIEEGLRPDGTDIAKVSGNKYATSTYREKERQYKEGLKNYDASRVNLRQTGDFQKAIKVKVGSEDIYFIDDDPKAEELIATWGQVLGLQDWQWNLFVTEVQEQIIKTIQDQLIYQR